MHSDLDAKPIAAIGVVGYLNDSVSTQMALNDLAVKVLCDSCTTQWH